MHKITLSLLALALTLTTQAKPRTRAQILYIAEKALSGQAGTVLGGSAHKAPARRALKVLQQDDALTVVGYEGGGYAIVTNDDLLPEVVGYSASTFTNENTNFRWWNHMMHESVRALVRKGVPSQIVRPDPNRFQAAVPQLMSTAWGQMEPFNDQCPLEYDRQGNVVGRTLVGCVSTALTQIMNYLQYPTQGTGTYTDMQTTDAWGKPRPITVDFSEYTYNYDLLQDTYTPGSYDRREADEVAKLSYTAGVSFAMIYGTAASGTYLDSATVGLKNHLGFPKARYYSRGDTDETTWMNRIYEELSNGRPLAYGGADDLFTEGGGGHCFVFDGYDTNGLVHVNWGWYGKNDGYYDVNLLNPRIHNFKNSQDMIVGLEVPSQETGTERELTVIGDLDERELKALVEKSKTQGLRKVDLSEAVLPGGLLPEKAFYGSRLTTIILPQNTLHIGDGAFGNCRNLSQVVFPATSPQQTYEVRDRVIYSADGLDLIEVLPYYSNQEEVMENFTSQLSLSEGIQSIHPYAFDGCFRIKGIVLPASLRHIGKQAFTHASSIKQIYARSSTPAQANLGAFNALDAGYTRLAIPAGEWDTYLRAGEWAHFFTLDNVCEMGTNIKARNVVRILGQKNPELRYQVLGDYVTGEPVLTCEADENSPVGEYPIVVERGTVQGANVVFTNGTLRIVDNETALEEIPTQTHAQDVATYTLDGRRTGGELRKGLYIRNGKKMIIDK